MFGALPGAPKVKGGAEFAQLYHNLSVLGHTGFDPFAFLVILAERSARVDPNLRVGSNLKNDLR